MAPKAKSNYQFHAMSKSFWSRDKHLLFKIGPLKLCLSHNCSQVLLFHNFVRCFVTDLVSSYVFAVWSWKSLECTESSTQKALLGAFFHLSMYHHKNLTHFIFEDVCSSSMKILNFIIQGVVIQIKLLKNYITSGLARQLHEFCVLLICKVQKYSQKYSLQSHRHNLSYLSLSNFSRTFTLTFRLYLPGYLSAS